MRCLELGVHQKWPDDSQDGAFDPEETSRAAISTIAARAEGIARLIVAEGSRVISHALDTIKKKAPVVAGAFQGEQFKTCRF